MVGNLAIRFLVLKKQSKVKTKQILRLSRQVNSTKTNLLKTTNKTNKFTSRKANTTETQCKRYMKVLIEQHLKLGECSADICSKVLCE